MTFINGYLHHIVVKLLKLKDKVYEEMRAYLEHAETVTGEHPNLLGSDGGGEYGSKEFEAYFKSKGIHHEKMNAYTPQENGVSKHMNRTLMESAHSMLRNASLPDMYWGYTILHAAHILNQLLTCAVNGNTTLYECFTGNKPSVVYLWIFGCKVHVHIPDEKHHKLDTKSVECMHIGYAKN